MSSEPFSLRSLDNLYIHLTNNAVQKNHPQYQQYEPGNQLSFTDFSVFLLKTEKIPKQQTHPSQAADQEHHLRDFRKCQGTNSRIDLNHKVKPKFQTFEIFGFDFMIDREFKVFLIEANTNPCIEESSPLLKQLIPRMLSIDKLTVDDAFRLTIDLILGGQLDNEILNQFQVNNYQDDFNMWEYLQHL